MSSARLWHNTRGRLYRCHNTRGTRTNSDSGSRSAGHVIQHDVTSRQSHTPNTKMKIRLFMFLSFLTKLLFYLQLYCRLAFAWLYSAVLLVRLNYSWRACACKYIRICFSGVRSTFRICSCTHKINGESLKFDFRLSRVPWNSEVQHSTLPRVPLRIFMFISLALNT